MRFIHTSDWHLGRRLHSEDLLAAHASFLAWLLDRATRLQVDAVLVAGDIYDRAQPPAEAIDLLDRTVAAFASAGVPLILTSGNHDSSVRLKYGGALFASSGIHVRAELDAITDPIVLEDDNGPVGFYGVPYLFPDAVMDRLGADRSHESVLSAAAKMIIDDAAERGLKRTVVVAHAFVRGGSVSESEREIRVGGIGDTPASVFHGFSFVALGHLHGPQSVRLTDSPTAIEYSGSPIAFSFSERDHVKSVTLVEMDEAGRTRSERIPVPVHRPLVQVKGQLQELIERGGAAGDLAHLKEAWVKVVLTDSDRPEEPMQRLRAVWPGTLVLDFAPLVGQVAHDDPLSEISGVQDPERLTGLFYEYVTGTPIDEARAAVVREAVEAARHQDGGA